MRAVVLDTETTGLDPATGDRVLEVAGIEIVNLVPTGREFHRLIDPERDVPPEATKVHGFTRESLRGKPRFAEVLPDLLDFLRDDPVVAHNAPFDLGFLDAEFARCGAPPIARARMVDTLEIAKRRFPGLSNSLDALCRRFSIDLSARTTHNALLDVRLLSEVYLELMGGRQPGLVLGARATAGGGGGASPSAASSTLPGGDVAAPPITGRQPRPIVPSEAELAAHAAFVARHLKGGSLWPAPSAPPGA